MIRSAAIALPVLLLGCSETGLRSITEDEKPPEEDTQEVLPEKPDEEPPEEEDAILEPVADAGPDRSEASGTAVTLDGSGSYDPQGLDPLSYEWRIAQAPPDSLAVLTATDAISPSFTPDEDGTYVFELVVVNTAGVADTTPDKVTVDFEPDPILEPVADAGADQVVPFGDVVYLDGTDSYDPQGLTPLTYAWSLLPPSGSTTTITNPAAKNFSLVPDLDGDYIFELTVMNAAGVWDTTPDQVVVTVEPLPPEPPVAHAGPDQSVDVGNTVILDGSLSTDPQGLTPLVYSWGWVDRPVGSAAYLSDTTVVNPSFYADAEGAYVFELTVMNTAGIWDPTPDEVVIDAVEPVIEEPVADAGADQLVAPLQTVQLDGSASYDPAGNTPLTYAWTQTSQPTNSTSGLSGSTTAYPSFFADLAGDYVFELTVRNSLGVWDSTPDTVVVVAEPEDGFYVEVSWDSTMDLDLHVLDGSTTLFGSGDCSYCNMTPSWGVAGTADDPSLDWDAIYGFGPETTTITSPSSGNYDIKVHFYGQDGYSSCSGTCAPSLATVKLYIGGVLTQTWQRTLTNQGDVWNVATVSWPSTAVTTTDSMSYTTLTTCW